MDAILKGNHDVSQYQFRFRLDQIINDTSRMNRELLTELPKDLLFGFGTSCYQIEGGWNADGKGESAWDRFVHTQPHKIEDRSSGDIACDSYNKYKEDVLLLKKLGSQIYRFSLSWTRILPTGFKNKINRKGIEYYNSLINELLKNGIEPMVTLYHWDLPQPLMELGGWTNPLLIDYFSDYAQVAFESFGDRVKKWITFNEPFEMCYLTYGVGMYPPGVTMSGIADYLSGHTILKSHAKVYHIYDEKYRPHQKGEIGISLSTNWIEPKSQAPSDIAAAQDLMEFQVGWFAHPIFSEKGDYPDILKKKVGENSRKEGFPVSRLPEFDEFWIKYIKGTSDFYGLNHYTSNLGSCDRSEGVIEGPSFENDHGVSTSRDPKWSQGLDWFNIVPWGFRKALNWVKNHYGNPVIYVTENGYGDGNPVLKDEKRISYFQTYLTEMLKAIYEDDCKIKIYTAWTLIDNFEWTAGYTANFGIYHVDFKDPSRKRTPKSSVEYFKYVLKHRKLPDSINYIL